MPLPPDLIMKALESLKEGITISDPSLPDNPLIYISNGFTRMTGYTMDEVIGKNCRYLQGPDTDTDTVRNIAEAIRQKRPIQAELLNYTKAGEPFWNNLSVSPLLNDRGEVTHFVGIQDNISALKLSRAIAAENEKQKSIAQALEKGEQNERHRIGLELHDNISQLLGTVKLYGDIAKQPGRMEEALSKSRELIDHAILEVRSLSHRLVKPDSVEEDFVLSLKTMLEQIAGASDLKITLDNELNGTYLPDELQLLLYRVLQEQLNNIIKHAEASEVMISLTATGNHLGFTVKDNGKGYDPRVLSTGIGHKNMHMRVKSFNGKIDMSSSPGAGMLLQVRIPLAS